MYVHVQQPAISIRSSTQSTTTRRQVVNKTRTTRERGKHNFNPSTSSPSYNINTRPLMTSPAFATFFEIFANGVVLTVALITTVTFAERCVKRSAPLNLSGLGASVVSVFYSVYGLVYWFNGIDGFNCTTLVMVNCSCISLSNALTYLHLFIKADISNRANPRWRSWIRWVGVATTVANWVTMTFVHASLVGIEDPRGVDGPRCKMGFDLVAFKLKWMAQLVNQAFQVGAFVWPLLRHVRSMGWGSSSHKATNRDTFFETLVLKALIAASVSLVFTSVVTGIAFDDKTTLPVYSLAVLDNAINLGAICFAVQFSGHRRRPPSSTFVPIRHNNSRWATSNGGTGAAAAAATATTTAVILTATSGNGGGVAVASGNPNDGIRRQQLLSAASMSSVTAASIIARTTTISMSPFNSLSAGNIAVPVKLPRDVEEASLEP